MTTIPEWVPPAPPETEDPTPVTPAGTVNALASDTGRLQATFAGVGEPVTVCYGEKTLGGRLFASAASSWYWMFAYVLCLGEVEGFQAVYVDGTLRFTTGTHGQFETAPNGMRMTRYHGTDNQTASAAIQAYIAGYTDTLVVTQNGQTRGLAYVVLELLHGSFERAPEVQVVTRGLRVVDPRNGHQSAPVWSTNPASILWDFCESPVYGWNRTVDPASVQTIAEENAAQVGGADRHTLNLAIDTVQEVPRWVELIALEYAGCYVRLSSDPAYELEFASARQTAVSRSFTDDSVIGDIEIRGAGVARTPNRVTVAYTRTDTFPWSTDYETAETAEVVAGTETTVQQTVPFPGIHNAAEARRRAVERLNALRIERLYVTWVTEDAAIRQQVGDVVTMTHWRGLTNQPLRLKSVTMVDLGRWRISAHNYDPARFSDLVVSAPPTTPGTFEDPFDPPALTGSLFAEEVIAPDSTGVVVSRVRVRVPYQTWPYVRAFRITVVGGGSVITGDASPEGFEVDTEWLSEALDPLQGGPAGVVLRVTARIVSTAPGQVLGPTSGVSVTAFGRYAPPPDVPTLAAVWNEANRSVEVTAAPVVDIGRVEYLFRYSTDPVVKWEDAIRLGREASPTNRIVISGFAEEGGTTYYYFCKAYDNVRLQSVNATRTSLTIPDTANRPVLHEIWPENANLGNFGVYRVLGKGWRAITHEATLHTMTSRFGSNPAWDRPTEPWHYTPGTWAGGGSSSASETVDRGTDKVRLVSWQAETTEHGNVITPPSKVQYRTLSFNSLDELLAVTQENYVHRLLKTYTPTIYVDWDDFPNANYAVILRFPLVSTAVTRGHEVAGTVSLNTDNSPFTIRFAQAPAFVFSETPRLDFKTGVPTALDPPVGVGLLTLDNEQFEVVSEALTDQDFDLIWTAFGV